MFPIKEITVFPEIVSTVISPFPVKTVPFVNPFGTAFEKINGALTRFESRLISISFATVVTSTNPFPNIFLISRF